MTYVVTNNCIKCKYTDCVAVCPVDAFHEGPNFLAINPEMCIDCDICVAECPSEAIYCDVDLPEDQLFYIELNAELSQEWPEISWPKEPQPDASKWRYEPNKLPYLIK